MTTNRTVDAFDYRDKTWGHRPIRPSDRDLPGLKFEFLRTSIDEYGPYVLEIGCSGGRHLSALLRLSPKRFYVGCDVDVESLREGKRHHEAIAFVAADGLRLPISGETFDAVYCMDYLEHLKDPAQAVREMLRILKEGGVLSVFVPCERNKWTFYQVFAMIFGYNVKEPAGGHVQSFTADDVLRLFTERGLEPTMVRYSYHLIGHTGDFLLFLLVHLNRRFAGLWWSQNRYYNDEAKRSRRPVVRLLNAMLSGVNYLAYWESKLFHRFRFLSAGIHLTFVKS